MRAVVARHMRSVECMVVVAGVRRTEVAEMKELMMDQHVGNAMSRTSGRLYGMFTRLFV